MIIKCFNAKYISTNLSEVGLNHISIKLAQFFLIKAIQYYIILNKSF